MGLFDAEIGNKKIPLYDIATLATGFYIGYAEGKGIDTSVTTEYVTKYGPTVFAVVATPITQKAMKGLSKCFIRGARHKLSRGEFIFTTETGEVNQEDLSTEMKEQLVPMANQHIDTLESQLQDIPYVKTTLMHGGLAALETGVGYILGRACSKIM